MRHHKLRDKLRDCIFPFVLPLSGIKIKYRLNVINKCNTIPGKPVIYACNHSQFSDIPMAVKAIGKRCYILLGKQKLYIADYIFFNLLGAVWVDRKDKKECYAKFSEPIYGEQLTDCRNGIQLLRDSIATLRYELMRNVQKHSQDACNHRKHGRGKRRTLSQNIHLSIGSMKNR